MTQSSDAYTVANGSGSTVRAALNADLQAANSNNSGTSAPSSPVAGMWWVDTTNKLVKQRDSTNSVWVVRAGLDGDPPSTLASASTCDLGSIPSNCANITGTTTITALGSSASTTRPIYFITFAGALTLTHNGTSLILPGAVSRVTQAGDVAIVQYLGSGNWRMLHYMPSALSGGRVNAVMTETGAVATGSTAIPWDDTKPQSNEGTQFLSQSYTVLNAGSTLYIDAVLSMSCGSADKVAVALFQDSGADALCATSRDVATDSSEQFTLSHTMPAGSAGATTFKVRSGSDGGHTMTLNGAGGSRKLGGVMMSSLRIIEVLP